MTKSSKTLLVILIAVLMCASTLLVACGGSPVSVSFAGAAQSVEKDGTVTAPDYTDVGEYGTFLGWGKEEGKNTSADVLFAKGASITYEQLMELATEGVVNLYPVISIKKTIALTWNGTDGAKTTATLVEGETPVLDVPAVTVGAKQEHIGWATSATATEAQFGLEDALNYSAVKDLASNGAIELFPVIKTYDLVVGVINVKFSVEDEEGNILHDVHYYVGLVKADFATLHADASVLYRIYEGNTAECGAQILADGDVDVVMAGNNVDSDSGANLTVIAKAKLASKYNSDSSRRGALIVESDLALDMYAMLIGAENKNVEVTLGESKTVVNSALGNEVDVSGISDPAGRVIVGFARTENATEAEIVGTVLDYSAVAKFATEGKVTLYPVFGAFDLIVGVWGVNGTNTYATAEEISAMEADFRTFLAGKGIESAVMRFDLVSGSSKEENATYYPTQVAGDVMVILGGKNVDTQCATTGKYKVINCEFSSARYASVYADRVTEAQKSIVDLFIEFVAEDSVEVTLGESKTVLSLIAENVVDISGVVVPSGKKIAGWATTENATEVLIAGEVLDYSTVSEHATDGKITLYPVFEDFAEVVTYDLIVAVWAVNGDNIYATDDQLSALATGFEAYLAQLGKTAKVRIDKVSGKTASYPDSIASDVMVVLSGKNVDDQCGTTGKTKITGVEFSSTRYYGYYADRISAEQQEIVDLFLAYLAPVA